MLLQIKKVKLFSGKCKLIMKAFQLFLDRLLMLEIDSF